MGDKTAIEWTDATWNPIRGCSRVSEGCRNCYAERVAARFSGAGMPYEGLARMTTAGPRWTGKTSFVEDHFLDPFKWKKPRRIFVNSMSDLFHESVPDSWINRIFSMMATCPQHTFQILTKRPERMEAYLNRPSKFACALPSERTNVWLGVSVEDQKSADERIPHLLRTPAAVRFLSCEPLLGAVNLCGCDESNHTGVRECSYLRQIDWVIVGGESGPGARPMHPDWARSIRDQCASAGVPFFFKQWGEWRMPVLGESYDTSKGNNQSWPAFLVNYDDGTVHCFANDQLARGIAMIRVGKSSAGRTLDGREHNEFPSIPSEAYK